jgi:hypothetical protein
MTTPSAVAGPTPGPHPQPGQYGQPPQPQKKRRTWLIILLVILALMLIGIVGCVALVGTAGKAVDEAVTEVSASEEASQQAEDDRNAPREVTPGKAFTIGSHKVLEGWKVKPIEPGAQSFRSPARLRMWRSDLDHVHPISSSSVSPGGLGNVDCSTGDRSQARPADELHIRRQYTSKYDKVTAEADF